jgi:hypothetical protein
MAGDIFAIKQLAEIALGHRHPAVQDSEKVALNPASRLLPGCV